MSGFMNRNDVLFMQSNLPPKRVLPEKILPGGFFSIVFLVSIFWWLWFRLWTGRTFEDAFITYRFARNLSSGNGFVFNAGERVLGTTTPLQTLLLAIIGKVVGPENIPVAASVTMFLAGAATGILTYAIFRRLGYSSRWSLVAMALFFGNNLITLTSVAGMETPLVLLLMASSIYLLLLERYTLAVVACSLLVLTRIDGLVWLVLCFASIVIRTKKMPWKALLAAFLVLLPWFAFSASYFGTVIPHTILAKRVIGAPAPVSLRHPASLAFFFSWYLEVLGCGHPIMLPIWPFVVLPGFWKWWHFEGEYRWITRIIVLFPFVFGLFLLVGNAQHFDWYLIPSLWCCLMLSTVGLRAALLWIGKRIPSARPVAIPAALVLFLVVYCWSQNTGRAERNRRFQGNEGMRRSLGLWLHDNTPSNSVVLMEAIGYQGYYSQRKILDSAGLISPLVVQLHKESRSNAETFFKILSGSKPDYIVLRSFEKDENLDFHGGKLFETPEQERYFEAHYKELKRFDGPYPDPEVWGNLWHLTVFGRTDSKQGAPR